MNVRLTEKARRQLERLDEAAVSGICGYLLEIEDLEDPRFRGTELPGKIWGIWRYRVADHRILCKLLDDVLLVLSIEQGAGGGIGR